MPYGRCSASSITSSCLRDKDIKTDDEKALEEHEKAHHDERDTDVADGVEPAGAYADIVKVAS